MKSLHPAAFAACLVVFFPAAFNAQNTDTFHLNGCARFWANDHPVNNVRMSVEIRRPDPLPDQMVFGSQHPDSACSAATVVTAPLFSFDELWIYGEKPDVAGDVRNGLSLCDLLLINKHILGLEPLNLYGLIAADVNRSGSVTGFDIVELRKVLLGIYTEFPNSPHWRILSPNCSFPNPANPFAAGCTAFPGDTLAALNGYTLNLTAVKTGDVDGDYAFDGIYPPLTNMLPATSFYMSALSLNTGETVLVPLYRKAPLTAGGFQLALRYDTSVLEIKDILPGAGSGSGNWAVFAAEGLLHNVTNYAFGTNIPDTLAQLKFFVKTAKNLSEAIRLDSSSGIKPRYVVDCNASGALELKFETVSGVSAAPALSWVSAASPNPFTGQTAVTLALDRAVMVRLDVTDLAGRLTYSREYELPTGTHRLEIPAAALPPGAIGFYRLSAGRSTVTGKLIRL